jgi:pentatricopeptide repeat protein
MDTGRARHRPELYNTALDICGHNGMLMDSARILHKMISSNVRPNERTITSVLNSIAEYVQKSRLNDLSSNRLDDYPSSRLDDYPRNRLDDSPSNRLDDSPSNGLDDSSSKKLDDPASKPSVDIQRHSEGFPGLEAFQLKSKQDAAQLAVKLYASWIEHSPSVVRKHPFNALLKDQHRMGA